MSESCATAIREMHHRDARSSSQSAPPGHSVKRRTREWNDIEHVLPPGSTKKFDRDLAAEWIAACNAPVAGSGVIVSSMFRRDRFDCFGERPVTARIHGAMLDRGACGIRPEVVAVFPIGPRPDRPGTKASAAIRADIFQDLLDTGAAEREFNEQIVASVESDGSVALQFSQAGRSSSTAVS